MSAPFTLRNGSILVTTEAPGGLYNAAQLRAIADVCEQNAAVIKATEDQRLAVYFAPEQLDSVTQALASSGLGVRHYQHGLHQPVSCVGALCEHHEQDALTTAMNVSSSFAGVDVPAALKIGINGCARCCVPCHTLDVSLVGEAGGYRISLGGKTSQFPELAAFAAENVPAAEVPALITLLVDAYKANAQPDETLHQVAERVGMSPFVQALSPYSQDAGGMDVSVLTADASPESAVESTAEPMMDDSIPPSTLEGADSLTIVGNDPAPESATEIDPFAADVGDLAALDDALQSTESTPVASEDSLPAIDDALDLGDLSDDLASFDQPAKMATERSVEPVEALDIDVLADMGSDSLDINPTSDQLSGESVPDLVPMESASLATTGPDVNVLDDDLAALDVSLDEITQETSPVSSLQSPESVLADASLGGSEGIVGLDAIAQPTPPAAAVPPAPKGEAGGAPDSVQVTTDADEGAFEDKFNLALVEEGKLKEAVDENADARLATLALVEATANENDSTTDSTAPMDETATSSTDMSDLDVRFGADGMLELAPGVEDAMAQETASLAEDGGQDNGFAGSSNSLVKPSFLREDQAQSYGGWNFAGVDFDGQGRVELQFTSGGRIAISLDKIPEAGKALKIGGQTITIVPTSNGVDVDIDGVAVFLPKVAA